VETSDLYVDELLLVYFRLAAELICLRGLRKIYLPSAILKPVPGLKCFHWLTWRG